VDAATHQPGELTLAQPLAEHPAPVPPALLNEFAATARVGEVDLTDAEFELALTAVGTKHNFGLAPGAQPSAAQQEKFMRALQLADFALARACALGREIAWQQFFARFRGPLRQAAIAVTGSSSLGEDLADSLYAELFGLSERDGQRRSPLASYSGRGSLMGWLRATLAQRHVDHHRRTWRESPMPEPESGVEFAAMPAQTTPEPAALSQLSDALMQTLQSLPPDDRFLLSAYFLDQRTLLEIARVLRVHEATVSRKLKRLTAAVHKQLLKQLQASGLSKRAAEEELVTDPRDLTLNLRTLLQTSSAAAFSQQKRGPNQAQS
jgi:RNA polymerase sigma-70 factor (ECF subfamily)